MSWGSVVSWISTVRIKTLCVSCHFPPNQSDTASRTQIFIVLCLSYPSGWSWSFSIANIVGIELRNPGMSKTAHQSQNWTARIIKTNIKEEECINTQCTGIQEEPARIWRCVSSQTCPSRMLSLNYIRNAGGIYSVYRHILGNMLTTSCSVHILPHIIMSRFIILGMSWYPHEWMIHKIYAEVHEAIIKAGIITPSLYVNFWLFSKS